MRAAELGLAIADGRLGPPIPSNFWGWSVVEAPGSPYFLHLRFGGIASSTLLFAPELAANASRRRFLGAASTSGREAGLRTGFGAGTRRICFAAHLILAGFQHGGSERSAETPTWSFCRAAIVRDLHEVYVYSSGAYGTPPHPIALVRLRPSMIP